MRNATFGVCIVALGTISAGTALASPISAFTPLSSNGTQAFAVYVFSDAADTLNLSESSPNQVNNIFCNYSNPTCTASAVGQIVDLGMTNPGIAFSLSDISVANVFRTDMLASDGYAHDKVSATVDASDAEAVAAAYAFFGQGNLSAAAAASIAQLGLAPETVVTFVGWEDRIGGDFDYNDLIFAFTDPPIELPEAPILPMFGVGLLGLAMFRRLDLKRSARF